MPISEAVLGRELDRLTGHFRPGEPKDRFAGWMQEYDTAFATSERTSDAIWQEAVTEAIRNFTKLPLVGEMRQVVEAVRPDFVRDDVPALPPPALRPAGPNREAFAWNVAIGRAKARKRFALIEAYRKANGLHTHHPVPEDVWRGRDEPTDAEVRAVAGEAMPPMAAAVPATPTTDTPGVPAWPGAAAETSTTR